MLKHLWRQTAHNPRAERATWVCQTCRQVRTTAGREPNPRNCPGPPTALQGPMFWYGVRRAGQEYWSFIKAPDGRVARQSYITAQRAQGVSGSYLRRWGGIRVQKLGPAGEEKRPPRELEERARSMLR